MFSLFFVFRNLFIKVLYICALCCLAYRVIHSPSGWQLLTSCELHSERDLSMYWVLILFGLKLDQAMDCLIYMVLNRGSFFMFYRCALLPLLPFFLCSLDPGYRFTAVFLNLLGGWRIPYLVIMAQALTFVYTFFRTLSPCEGYSWHNHWYTMFVTLQFCYL